MKCVFGIPLPEDEIIDAAIGDASAETLEHLEACQFCQDRVREFQKFEARLFKRLHPDRQTLLDFSYGLLHTEDTSLVKEHLQDCRNCQAIIAEYEAVKPDMSELPHAPLPDLSWIPTSKLMPRVTPQELSLIHISESQEDFDKMFVLGGDDMDEQVFVAEAGGVKLFLNIQPVEKVVSLSGQVVAEDQEAWEGAVVSLTRRDEQPWSQCALLDDLGQFTCTQIPLGVYKLRIAALSGTAVNLYALRLP